MPAALALNAYRVTHTAVESGVGWGWRHLWKHRERPANLPDDETVIAEITQYVMTELSDAVDWDRSACVDAHGTR